MKTYSALYVDPPWQYKDKTPRGGAEHHYRTLTLDELVRFEVQGRKVIDLAAPDCALFMWATWPMMVPALFLIKAWGFTYKTCAFTWCKTTGRGEPAFGLRRNTRGNTEPCLLAVRGKPHRIDAGVPQVILDESFTEETLYAPRGAHSAKPPEARERIVRLLGDVPRVELFARERATGWDSFGDQLAPAEAA